MRLETVGIATDNPKAQYLQVGLPRLNQEVYLLIHHCLYFQVLHWEELKEIVKN